MTSYQYRKSHCGDKTILRPSYLHNRISYTGKTTLYIESGPWSLAVACPAYSFCLSNFVWQWWTSNFMMLVWHIHFVRCNKSWWLLVSFLDAHKQYCDCHNKAIQISTTEYYIPNVCVDSLILKVFHGIEIMDSSFTCAASSIMNF